MLLICDETTSHAWRIAWLVKPDKPTHDAIASMCGVVCRINRAWVLGRTPQLRHHSASREKTVNKNLLERAASFYSPIFPPLLDPASKPLLHCIPGTNVCGFFLVSAFTGIAVGVSARFHYVTLFLVTRQPQHPRAR